MSRLQPFRKTLQAFFTQPLVYLLARTGVTPNAVTLVGFLVVIVSAWLTAIGQLFAAGWVLLFSGFFDILDGALARHTGHVTLFGGVLDSTLDRLAEAASLIGIVAYYLFHSRSNSEWIIIMTAVSLTTSFAVSYIRSRAEAADLKCQVGIGTRTERVIILVLGLLLSRFSAALPIAVAIITLLSSVTVVQRLLYVYGQTKTGG